MTDEVQKPLSMNRREFFCALAVSVVAAKVTLPVGFLPGMASRKPLGVSLRPAFWDDKRWVCHPDNQDWCGEGKIAHLAIMSDNHA